MATAIIMPKFGFTQDTATIVQWLKHDGDKVDVGDPVAEVTTDKVNMEVEAPVSGVLTGLRYEEGDTVPVTEVICYVVGQGEKIPDATRPVTEVSNTAPDLSSQEPKNQHGHFRITPVAEHVARENGIDISEVPGSGPGGRVTRSDVESFLKSHPALDGKVRATPAARRVASELGADLRQISGNGPRGRIQGEDVRKWAARAQATPEVQASSLHIDRARVCRRHTDRIGAGTRLVQRALVLDRRIPTAVVDRIVARSVRIQSQRGPRRIIQH